MAPAPAAPASVDETPLVTNADPFVVKMTQKVLAEVDYYHGKIDGVFTAHTRDAIAAYETDEGLQVTGEPGYAIVAHVRTGKPAVAPIAADPVSPVAAEIQWISWVQNALSWNGYYAGEINGIYDDATRDAILRFQQDNGLSTTGQVTPALLSVLNSANPHRSTYRPDRFSQGTRFDRVEPAVYYQPRQRINRLDYGGIQTSVEDPASSPTAGDCANQDQISDDCPRANIDTGDWRPVGTSRFDFTNPRPWRAIRQ